MLKRESKLGLIMVTILVMLFTMSAGVEADYWYNAGKVFLDITNNMYEVKSDFDKLPNSSISASAFLDRISKHKRTALDNLEKIIKLVDRAPDKTLHAEMVGLIADWYLAVQLLEDGIKKDNMDKLKSAITVMNFFGERVSEIESRIKQKIGRGEKEE